MVITEGYKYKSLGNILERIKKEISCIIFIDIRKGCKGKWLGKKQILQLGSTTICMLEIHLPQSSFVNRWLNKLMFEL